MIVCSCNVLTDAQIRDTVKDEDPNAPRTPAQAYRCLGCSPNCGRCLVTVRRILAEARVAACAVGCPICPAGQHPHPHQEPAPANGDFAPLIAAE